jgi:hypothetical protein
MLGINMLQCISSEQVEIIQLRPVYQLDPDLVPPSAG